MNLSFLSSTAGKIIGAIVILIFIFLGYQAFNYIYPSAERSVGKLGSVTGLMEDQLVQKYDNKRVSGADVLTFAATEGQSAGLSVRITTGTTTTSTFHADQGAATRCYVAASGIVNPSTNTCGLVYTVSQMKNIELPTAYINPKATFLATLSRDQAQVVRLVTFVQQP